jgi:hypothetical protein
VPQIADGSSYVPQSCNTGEAEVEVCDNCGFPPVLMLLYVR